MNKKITKEALSLIKPVLTEVISEVRMSKIVKLCSSDASDEDIIRANREVRALASIEAEIDNMLLEMSGINDQFEERMQQYD